MDTGYFSEANGKAFEDRGIDPYLATGCAEHHAGWRAFFEEAGEAPPETASVREKRAYKLRTELGKAIYRRRKCRVEPVIGIIKEALGLRQFSLRGLECASGEWSLVCLAYNLRRLHVIQTATKAS